MSPTPSKNKEVTTVKVKRLLTTIKSAFPLLQFEKVPNSVPASPVSCSQIILATYVAYKCHPIISTRDILFCVLFPTYLALANHLRFANNLLIRQRPKDHPHNVSTVSKEFFSGATSKWFMKYMFVAVLVGLVLPLFTVFKAPRDVARLTIPHLFVLWCQIIGESIVMLNPFVHRFVALLLPIGFSVYRLTLVAEWFLGSISLFQEASMKYILGIIVSSGYRPIGHYQSWYVLSLVLSGISLVFWTYNLFVVLLLRITPEYLSDDKCQSPEVQVVSLPFIKEPKKEATRTVKTSEITSEQ